MTVYVDEARNAFRGMIMCHMIADTVEELHAMALRVGLRRAWFQPFSFPHYDVSIGKRLLAIRAGALSVDRRELVTVMRRLRASPTFVSEWRAALPTEANHS